jgi:type I restriction enzyme M protein
MTSSAIVQKLWNYCNVLRDDGMSYGDYVEQLTYLLFLKMADERTKPPYNHPSPVPEKFTWQSLLKKDGDALFAMNLLLHGIGSEESMPIVVGDALAKHPGEFFDIVLTNPPFGKKSSFTVVGAEGEASKEKETYERDDFWATTSNKQLNFLQHVKSLLKANGRAAIVVPDNVLFEGGAGETIRKKLLHECDVHTLLRLPTGLFYAQGVKANVLFFDKKPGSMTPWTKQLWIYDLRTNMHFTLKTKTLKREDLDEFVTCYNPKNRHQRKPLWSEKHPTGRWRAYDYDELIARDKASLDIFWLKDESLEASENLPEPGIIAQEIVEDLEAALEQFREIANDLENGSEKKG